MRKYRLFIFNFIIALGLLLFAIIITNNTNSYHVKKSSSKIHKLNYTISEKDKIDGVFARYSNSLYGVDFSHYQGAIDWQNVKNIHGSTPISFVFLRSTMGSHSKDKYFKHNWKKAKKHNVIVGAYHYYRPNENSTKQANNFIKTIKLAKGDLPPVLDIEKYTTHQTIKSLKKGLKNWLNIVEKHYGVKPIIYTGDTFYRKYLSDGKFDKYPLWIANFNKINHPQTSKWKIWQFSEQGIIKGSNEKVDFNVFNGSRAEFNRLLVN